MNHSAPPAKKARTDARRVEGEGTDGTDARRVEGEGGDGASDRTATDPDRDESHATTDGEPGPE
jgi:hypothetical protein